MKVAEYQGGEAQQVDRLSVHTSEDWARRINDVWKPGAAAFVKRIIDVGRLLTEAKQDLGHGKFQKELIKLVPFGPRQVQMLMKIASHEVLSDAKHASHLPPCWTTLHELSHLRPEEMRKLIANGKIHPAIERQHAAALTPGKAQEGLRPVLSTFTITLLQEASRRDAPEDIRDYFRKLKEDAGPRTPERLKEVGRWFLDEAEKLRAGVA